MRDFTIFFLNTADTVLSMERLSAATLIDAISSAREHVPACDHFEIWEATERLYCEKRLDPKLEQSVYLGGAGASDLGSDLRGR